MICERCAGEGYLTLYGVPRPDVICGACLGSGEAALSRIDAARIEQMEVDAAYWKERLAKAEKRCCLMDGCLDNDDHYARATKDEP